MYKSFKLGLSHYIVLLLLFNNIYNGHAFWNWILGKPSESNEQSEGSEAGSMVSVPFELKTADEKFLEEGEKYGVQFSSLDRCHHKTIMLLKSSCSGLTEEDIGKLSVQLLNCQSSVEGRPIHPCRASMSLKECTRNMDQHTWNAYHIVSNRARAVCYATRQLQFSLKTEMTVNKLASTAQSQLHVLREIEEGQGRLSLMTDQTLDLMSSGQKEMLERQERLKSTQQVMQTFVASNLRDLTREKALIAMGNQELSNMTKAIKSKLDEASCLLQQQTAERQQDHQAVVQELARLQDQARQLYTKLEAGTRLAQAQLMSARIQHREALAGLSQLNDTVGFMLRALGETRAELVTWAAQSGVRLSTLVTYLQHLGFGLLAALTAAFIQAPPLPRLCLLLLLATNCFLTLEAPDSALTFPSLALALFTIYLGNITYILSKSFYLSKPHQPAREIQAPRQNGSINYPFRAGGTLAEDVSNHRGRRSPSPAWSNHSTAPLETPRPPHFQHVSEGLRLLREHSPANSSLSETASVRSRPLCTSRTQTGHPCKKRSLAGSPYCSTHLAASH